jgi:hypothetical protein
MGKAMGRASVLVLAVVIAVGFGGSGRTHAAQAPLPRTIVVYGDSILNESTAVLAQDLDRAYPGAQVVFHDADGTAICDWLPQMREDTKAAGQVGLVVLTFDGDRSTPCMTGRAGPWPGPVSTKGYVDAWTADTHTAARLWARAGVRVLLVGPPGKVGTERRAFPYGAIDQIDRREAARWSKDSVRDLDGGAALVATTTAPTYERTVPCTSAERVGAVCGPGGTIQVRAGDGFHLCTVERSIYGGPCPIYSPGVSRWSDAIARAALAFRSTQPPFVARLALAARPTQPNVGR